LKYGILQAVDSLGVITSNDVAHPEQLSGSVSMNGVAKIGSCIDMFVSSLMKNFPFVSSLHKSCNISKASERQVASFLILLDATLYLSNTTTSNP